MGWANCGEDSNGRPIGYAHEATCDHPGCDEEIDRGLGYACGEMHGEDEMSCERYFCDKHLYGFDLPPGDEDGAGHQDTAICAECLADWEKLRVDEPERWEGGGQ